MSKELTTILIIYMLILYPQTKIIIYFVKFSKGYMNRLRLALTKFKKYIFRHLRGYRVNIV